MSEQLPIDLLAKLLGEWFRYVNDIIEKNGGGVDKFIGDAVMACWLMSDKNPELGIQQTLKAAYDIYLMTNKLSQAYPKLPKPLRIGVGINTGEAIQGDMGSGRLQDYTVLGDAVNVAFRLEKASKELDADLVISHNSFKYYPSPVWEGRQQAIKVKGKGEPVQVYPLKFQDLEDIVT
jgi:adenylate cyclase